MPAQGDPEEWPLWTRRTGVCRPYPLPGYKAARSERRWPRPKSFAIIDELLNSKLAYAFT